MVGVFFVIFTPCLVYHAETVSINSESPAPAGIIVSLNVKGPTLEETVSILPVSVSSRRRRKAQDVEYMAPSRRSSAAVQTAS